MIPLSVGRPGKEALRGWRWVRLTELARLETGHTPSRNHPEWWGGPIPWISLSDIRELDGKVAQDTLEHTNEQGIANSAARLLPEATVVLSRTASVGFVTIMGRPMATSQDFVNWVCGPELDSHFLAYLLRASRAYIRSLSSGAIHQTVYMPTVESFFVSAPSVSKQREIASSLSERLSMVERARAAAEARLEAARALPAATLRSVFGRAGDGWREIPLGTVLSLRKDVVHPQDMPRGRATFVGLEHIESGTGLHLGSEEVELANLTGRKPMFKEGEIVYGYLRPYLNKVWVAEFDGLCSVDQYVFRVDHRQADPHFIAAFMRSPSYLRRAPITTTPGQLPRIRTDEVASVLIALPPIGEQKRLLAELTGVTAPAAKLRQYAEAEQEAIEALPAALLRQAFSGEL